MAANVTAPSTAASWATKLSASPRSRCASTQSGGWPAASLATASARRFARQSTAVSVWPSERRATPIEAIAPWAGIQVRRSEVTKEVMSPSSRTEIRDQTCANMRVARVASATPAAAAARTDWQSVRMLDGLSVDESTNMTAHNSAAAAVRIHGGGTAYPYATRSPASETTTIAQPVRRKSHAGPNFMDPSVYHRKSERSISGGSGIHRTATSTCKGGRGIRRASIPRVRSNWRRSGWRDAANPRQLGGGSGHPPEGSEAGHSRR